MVFMAKYRANDTIAKWKARLAKTVCTVEHYEIKHTLLAVSASNKWVVHQRDFKTAFFNVFREDIFMNMYMYMCKVHMLDRNYYGDKVVCRFTCMA